MPRRKLLINCISALALLLFIAVSVSGQTLKQHTDDVIRIDTELVQTGVMVFDKQGRFVDGLNPEQFELRVEGKPVQLSFFDRVTAWTDKEEQVRAAAVAPRNTPTTGTREPVIGGRTIIFFIDDLHLSLGGIGRTRAAVNHFIDHDMSPIDQVALTSASGQIGFLQQLTNNKTVLRAALARVKQVPYVVRDNDQPPMTEFIAIRILNGDLDTLNFYADEMLRRTYRAQRGLNRNAVYQTVKTRANQILLGLESVTSTSLESLNNLMETTGRIAGRKLIFYFSDGFYLDGKNSIGAANDRLRRVIDTATRSNSVIYTIDARGLFAPIADASGERPFDPTGRLDRASVGEGTLSQDGLNALAGDTGGRFLKNQNYFDRWVERMLDETSNYYLLAWRPPVEEQKGGNFKRIEVSIRDRPDLTVRLPRGFLKENQVRSAKTEVANSDSAAPVSASGKGSETALLSALAAPSAQKGLPTTLAVSFVDVPNTGPVLTASTQMATDVLGYGTDGKETAAIDLAAVVLNDHGKQAGSFKTRVKVNPPAQASATRKPGVIYSHRLLLKPGLYQVRVAARDAQSGRVGSAAQWIEIPELGSKDLTLSSLLLGGQFIGSGQKQTDVQEQVQFSVDRKFARGTHVNFLTIVYNAARAKGGNPELDAQIKILRGGQTIVNSPVRKVHFDASIDAARIPYGANIALQTLPVGRYLLQVTISDRVAKTSSSQEVIFEIE